MSNVIAQLAAARAQTAALLSQLDATIEAVKESQCERHQQSTSNHMNKQTYPYCGWITHGKKTCPHPPVTPYRFCAAHMAEDRQKKLEKASTQGRAAEDAALNVVGRTNTNESVIDE